jgi:LysM repeat protein
VPWVVDPGENLFRIAMRYGMTAEELQAANCLPSADEIMVGQTIWVPYYVTPTPTPCYRDPDFVAAYTVQPGDTLFRLALLYGLTAEEMQVGNCLDRDWLIEGEVIYVPYLIPTLPPSELTEPDQEVQLPSPPPAPPPPTAPPTPVFGRVPPPGGGTPTPQPDSECGRPTWIPYTTTVASAMDLGGEFQITVNSNNLWAVARAGCEFDDVVISVTAWPISAPQDSSYSHGLVCRYSDDGVTESYYAFVVDSQGQYAIVKVKDGLPDYLQYWTPAEGIRTGEENDNQLEATCQGSTLRFWVNGSILREVSDPTLDRGDVGLIVVTTGGVPVTIGFESGTTRPPP